MTPTHRAFIAVSLLWLVYELAFGLLPSRRGAGEGRADAGSWWWLTLSVTSGVLLSGAVARHTHVLAPSAAVATDLMGIALVAAGFALRARAMSELGRSFTTRVAVDRDQRVVDTGPYSRVRHPAYLGDLVAFAGIGLGQASAVSAALLWLLCVPPLLYRIRVEEAALGAVLGESWRAYAARTPALLPFPRPGRPLP
ncbi:isoprenylcysteine carboxylmethyltransferase family protein [Myxococcota bacterium]|nr:isoprenylcysteine carboxylmethyltransferase family protein [Myxococcota bacterium]